MIDTDSSRKQIRIDLEVFPKDVCCIKEFDIVGVIGITPKSLVDGLEVPCISRPFRVVRANF
jgi:hypothetical protein